MAHRVADLLPHGKISKSKYFVCLPFAHENTAIFQRPASVLPRMCSDPAQRKAGLEPRDYHPDIPSSNRNPWPNTVS